MNLRKKIFVIFAFCAVVGSPLSVCFTVDAQETKIVGNGGIIEGLVKTPWVKRYPALVYIEQVEGEFPPPTENVHMSQKNMVFMPRIMPILKGSTIDFTNDDTVVHNVFTPPGSAQRFNTGNYGVGVTKTITFNTLGESTLLCSVHPEMLAYVIVLQNPYFALTDKTGKFEIRNVPSGTYQLKVWNEKLKEVSQKVVIQDGKTTGVEFKGLKKR